MPLFRYCCLLDIQARPVFTTADLASTNFWPENASTKIFIPHMRGSDHLKTVLRTNNEAKIILAKSYILYYIIAISMYGYSKMSLLLFALLSIPDLLALGMLHWLTIPTFIFENGAKKLVNVRSLNSSGLVSFFFDLMFWGLLCKILIVFSKKWALLYFGILFSLISEFIYKPYKSIRKI